MKRHLTLIGAMVFLAGCVANPTKPAPTFHVGPAGEIPVQGESGYGVQALGTKDFIVRYKPTTDRTKKKPRKGKKKADLKLDRTELYTAESEAEVLEMVNELGQDSEIEFAEPDRSLAPDLIPNDPQFTSNASNLGDNKQWYLPKIGAPAAWDTAAPLLSATPLKVAIIDTGVKLNHPDLVNKIAAGGYDFYQNDADPTDTDGHGTHVAGIVAAEFNNAVGVSGTAPHTQILAYRAGATTLSTSAITNSITDAVAKGAKVINMSLGMYTDSATLRAAVDKAVAAGVVVACSAGNDNTSKLRYPGAYESSIAVGATTDTDAKASFSNFGTWVDMAAPGVSIYNTTFDGAYGYKQGTSMATPVVAGAAAMLRAKHPTATVDQIRKLLETTGSPATGFTGSVGLERLNISAAIAAALPADTAATFDTIKTVPTMYTAAISWNANEPVIPKVTIALNSALTTSPVVTTGTDATTRPSFSLASLKPGTTYYYKLEGTDPKGNVTSSAVASFQTAAVTFTSLKVTPSAYAPVLTWTNNVPTKRLVKVATTSAGVAGAAGVQTTVLETAHKHVWSGLTPNTTYYYQITATDQYGNTMNSAIGTFKTPTVTFTGIVASSSNDAMSLAWKTNVPLTGVVSYGLSSASLTGSQATAATPAASHVVKLTGLKSATTYYYKITGTDAAGNTYVSTVKSFKTQPLTVTELQASEFSSTGAKITWATSTNTDRKLYYGLTSTTATTLVTSADPISNRHAMTLSGLTPNRTYYVKVVCTDAGGNSVTSSVVSFKTLP